jgi:hypothetical protein
MFKLSTRKQMKRASLSLAVVISSTTLAFATENKELEAMEWKSIIEHPRELEDVANGTLKTKAMQELVTCSSRVMRGYIKTNGGFKKSAVVAEIVRGCRIEYENLKSAIGAPFAISLVAGGVDWGEIEFKREGSNALSTYDR